MRRALSIFVVAFAALACLTALASSTSSSALAASGSWAPTASIAGERADAAATLLQDGRVLVTGGFNDDLSVVNTVAIFDPTTGSWSPAADMHLARYAHAATLLPDGRVLVVGGEPYGQSAEAYNPGSNSWSVLPNYPGPESLVHSPADLLPNGKVLAGHWLFDPPTNSWSGTLNAPSFLTGNSVGGVSASLLDGRVLRLAILGSSYAAMYDSLSNAWHNITLPVGRSRSSLLRLPNGTVLLAGGVNLDGVQSSVEVFHPETETWTPGPPMTTARYDHVGVRLADGRILVAGGDPSLDSAEVYDPATNTWETEGSMNVGRFLAAGVLLGDGRVLVVGGVVVNTVVPSAEIFTPGSPPPTTTPTAAPIPTHAVAIDTDVTNGSGPCDVIDSIATFAVGVSFQIAVCFQNSESVPLAAFEYRLNYNDNVILAPEVFDDQLTLGVDDNPDANAGSTAFSTPDLGGNWNCRGGSVSAFPKGDVDGVVNGTGVVFSGGCQSPAGPNTLRSGPLSVVTFNATSVGSTALAFQRVTLTQDDLIEAGSCNPTVDRAMPCIGATINIVAAPTSTPTTTPTAIATATPTPPGPTVNKSPNLANLFLCEGPTCVNNGEGTLVINEIASNITAPLGGFEIQVKFDHKIFNVLWTPNVSATLWPGRTPNCSLQIVTENWILFGCVSNGPTGAGFVGGPISLGTLTLTPNADMKFRLHPGNDNGVVRMILDENCELAETLGHPLPGSINGGLTVECGDAAITVRVLEADLNLDCTVDIQDEQAISMRYGTFFGNIFYDPWYDLEPALKDFDIDIKDVQKVFGRDGSTCAAPIRPQPPVPGLSVGPL